MRTAHRNRADRALGLSDCSASDGGMARATGKSNVGGGPASAEIGPCRDPCGTRPARILKNSLTILSSNEWNVTKYDEWGHYRNQFIKVCGTVKAVDVLALERKECCWLLEIKDYREHVPYIPLMGSWHFPSIIFPF